MISVPSADPVGALVPHTLQEPLPGAASGPLAGLTFMVKDLFAINGRKVSNGNPNFYEHATPAHETAPVITRLLEAGASCTGITICDEFFYSVLGSNAHYGQPVNSRAPEHVTGGSSCGSAAAVAASMCDFALGSDTGGSIRVPASFSGLYGLRPSFGRIDMDGATAMAPSYDTIGFLAREAAAVPQDRPCAARRATGRGEDRAPDHGRRYLRPCRDQRRPGDVARALKHRPGAAAPEQHILAGEDIDDWRDAFRLIQGFEIQSTLLPFIRSHNVELGPGIKERFDGGGQISFAEAEAARSKFAPRSSAACGFMAPGSVIVLPTTPTLPPEREHSRRRLLRRVPHGNARLYLPRRPCRPAADLHSRDRGRRLPDRPLLHRLEGRRRGPARSGRPP